MLPRDIGRQVPWPAQIEQNFGFRFLQAQPPGHPLESLDIVSLIRPSIGWVARGRSRRVASDIGGHPKEFPYIQFAPGSDRFRELIHRVNIHASR